MRTYIVRDDQLMRETLKATGLGTKKEAAEPGLRTRLRLQQQRNKATRQQPPPPRHHDLGRRPREREDRQVILVDSSVWIDYFRGTRNEQTDILDVLLSSEPVAVGDLMLAEVLQGFNSKRDRDQARSVLFYLHQVDIRGKEITIQAARNFRTLRLNGVTARKTIDVIIATKFLENDLLLHSDRDFDAFEKHL